jgi:hypothetical protein
VIEAATTFRSKEQVLLELSKALQFSPESLVANRKGKLSKDQIKNLATRCAKPGGLALLFAVAPFVMWTRITSSSQQISFGAALPVFFNELTHVKDLFEAHGTIGGVSMLGSVLISLGIAALLASRFPMALYFDLLSRKVITQEGRVVAREETINRPNGRDPIEKYFFCLRYLNMPVNLAAYRAIEPGSIYLVYLLPRSELLVSMEPKMEDTPERAAAQAVSRGESSSARVDQDAHVQPTSLS